MNGTPIRTTRKSHSGKWNTQYFGGSFFLIKIGSMLKILLCVLFYLFFPGVRRDVKTSYRDFLFYSSGVCSFVRLKQNDSPEKRNPIKVLPCPWLTQCLFHPVFKRKVPYVITPALVPGSSYESSVLKDFESDTVHLRMVRLEGAGTLERGQDECTDGVRLKCPRVETQIRQKNHFSNPPRSNLDTNYSLEVWSSISLDTPSVVSLNSPYPTLDELLYSGFPIGFTQDSGYTPWFPLYTIFSLSSSSTRITLFLSLGPIMVHVFQ